MPRTKPKSITNANKKIKKKKALMVEATNALVPVPAPLSCPELAPVSAPATNGSVAGSQGKGKDKDNSERLSGFIFLCNGRTKPECYQYRVFGLPGGRREVLEKINVGTKLFLFDIDLKLLYGVYDATSSGKLNLEPAAFGGRFPAQVRFNIYKDCLPLPESAFKNAIQDNYQGAKFSQELTGQQVRNLLSLFRPVAASSSAPVPPSIPYMARPQAMPPPLSEDQFHPSVRFPPPKDSYMAGMQHGHAPSIMEPLCVQQIPLTSQHEWYRTNATTGHIHPTIEQQRLPAPSDPYYLAETQQPFLVADTAQTVQDLYFRPEFRVQTINCKPARNRISSFGCQ
ncbi:uncharacterized protein LOC132284900 isoform X2 [Cornus florida]|uniref:uncharacterized protein LOC132284900 isoform X2 n=1 Tax=Cornus florida TaxID=4283 RepID=UPI00289E7A1B|nr:uncharacterized protein LOC132284900 isoform X2 [Cornus florida]